MPERTGAAECIEASTLTVEELDRLAAGIAERLLTRMGDERPMLSPAGLAERLGISERTARELLADKEIPSVKIGGSRRVDQRDVDAYVAARRSDE